MYAYWLYFFSNHCLSHFFKLPVQCFISIFLRNCDYKPILKFQNSLQIKKVLNFSCCSFFLYMNEIDTFCIDVTTSMSLLYL